MFVELLKRIKALDVIGIIDLLGKMSSSDLNFIDEKGRTALHVFIKTLLESEKQLSMLSSPTDRIKIEKLNSYNKKASIVVESFVTKMSEWAINLADNDRMTALNYASLAINKEISWTICGIHMPTTIKHHDDRYLDIVRIINYNPICPIDLEEDSQI